MKYLLLYAKIFNYQQICRICEKFTISFKLCIVRVIKITDKNLKMWKEKKIWKCVEIRALESVKRCMYFVHYKVKDCTRKHLVVMYRYGENSKHFFLVPYRRTAAHNRRLYGRMFLRIFSVFKTQRTRHYNIIL